MELTTEPDGTTYNFESVILKFDCVNGLYGGNYRISLFSDTDANSLCMINPYFSEQSTKRMFMNFMFLSTNGIIIPAYTQIVERYTPGGQIYLAMPYVTEIYLSKNINRVLINTKVKAGTKIYVYAVRAQ